MYVVVCSLCAHNFDFIISNKNDKLEYNIKYIYCIRKEIVHVYYQDQHVVVSKISIMHIINHLQGCNATALAQYAAE